MTWVERKRDDGKRTRRRSGEKQAYFWVPCVRIPGRWSNHHDLLIHGLTVRRFVERERERRRGGGE